MTFYTIYSLVLLGGFMTTMAATSINANVICDNLHAEIQYLRNNALRLLLSDKLNRTKMKYGVVKRMINRNIVNKYNKVLSRCYDLNYNYNCLTDTERTLLEVIVSLIY
jgi:hypothetical protein